ncbi:TPA: response regulator, partial [Streptococcus agalactiae]|nr:response regulator [Streptococcus agalactiae]
MYRLLIVEDEYLIRKWLRYAIDYQSLNILVVGEAKDGKEGAQLIQEEQPDIVLSDI